MTGAVFLDLRKAFDLDNNNTLLTKLPTYNVSSNDIIFFQSYLQGRQQRVLVNGTYSQENPVTRGLPQGSVFGPLLFCVFINDLLLRVSSTSVQRDLFADDGTLNTSNNDIGDIRRDLQQSLDDVSKWCTNWMALNQTKTRCILLATRLKNQKNNSF